MRSLLSNYVRRQRCRPLSSSATSGLLQSADEYCLNLVKQSDVDGYLAGLLVPSKFRPAYFAIRAYNVEIATIKDQMGGNALAGRIRFQWWRDTIEQIYSGAGVTGSGQPPIALAMSHYCKRHSLSRHWLERSLDARQRDSTQNQPETLDDMENYAEQGHSSILYLLLESIGIREDDEKANFMASHIGVASGLTTLLRGFPHHISKRHIYLPAETMRKHGLTAAQVLAGPPGLQVSLQNCLFDVASQAHGHLDRARALRGELSGKTQTAPLIAVCAPAVRSNILLEVLRKANFNPYDDRLHGNTQLSYQLQLLRTSWFKSF